MNRVGRGTLRQLLELWKPTAPDKADHLDGNMTGVQAAAVARLFEAIAAHWHAIERELSIFDSGIDWSAAFKDDESPLSQAASQVSETWEECDAAVTDALSTGLRVGFVARITGVPVDRVEELRPEHF